MRRGGEGGGGGGKRSRGCSYGRLTYGTKRRFGSGEFGLRLRVGSGKSGVGSGGTLETLMILCCRRCNSESSPANNKLE